MISWSIEEITLPLKYSWKISRNETQLKRNLIFTVSDGIHSGKGEAAPNIRYGESPELVKEKFNTLLPDLTKINTLDGLTQIIDNQNIYNSLKFGLESAFIHFCASRNNRPVYQELNLKAPGPVYTSYTLPIMEPGKVKDFINEHNLLRFKSLKIKINQEGGEELIREVSRITSTPLRIDANEAWHDVDNLIVFMNKFKNLPIEFFEQPLPAGKLEEYKYLKKYSPFELVADESVTDHFDAQVIASGFHGVNMKLMKAGGYRNGIRILQESKKQGLKTMIGCMVETSLGIFSAINLCNDINYIDLDGFFLIENEPFNMISEREGRLFNVT